MVHSWSSMGLSWPCPRLSWFWRCLSCYTIHADISSKIWTTPPETDVQEYIKKKNNHGGFLFTDWAFILSNRLWLYNLVDDTTAFALPLGGCINQFLLRSTENADTTLYPRGPNSWLFSFSILVIALHLVRKKLTITGYVHLAFGLFELTPFLFCHVVPPAIRVTCEQERVPVRDSHRADLEQDPYLFHYLSRRYPGFYNHTVAFASWMCSRTLCHAFH